MNDIDITVKNTIVAWLLCIVIIVIGVICLIAVSCLIIYLLLKKIYDLIMSIYIYEE